MGGALKTLALLARVLFFILVIPILPEGELAIYVFVSSTAVIVATISILGLDEELPRIVAGDFNKARAYFLWFFALSFLALLALVATIVYPSVFLAVVLFSITILAGRYLQGLVRSIDAAIQERLQNLPWVLFMAVVLVLRLDRAFDLIVVMTIAMGVVQWYGFSLVKMRQGGRKVSADSRVSLFSVIGLGLSHGISRLSSNLFLLGFIRGPILWPVWLGIDVQLDQIAFAIAVGEVVSQFGQIPVNRAYARWCRSTPVERRAWRSAISSGVILGAALATISIVTLAIVALFNWLPPQVQSSSILAQGLVFYSLVPAFRLLRYILWSRGILGLWISGVTFSMFVVGGIIILAFAIDYWFLASVVVLIAAWVAMSRSAKEYFSM